MPLAGFEPPISAGEWPQTYALDRLAARIGFLLILQRENLLLRHKNFAEVCQMNIAETNTENCDTYKSTTKNEPQEVTAYDNLRAPMCKMPFLTLRSYRERSFLYFLPLIVKDDAWERLQRNHISISRLKI
jgi:hypothetical protein